MPIDPNLRRGAGLLQPVALILLLALCAGCEPTSSTSTAAASTSGAQAPTAVGAANPASMPAVGSTTRDDSVEVKLHYPPLRDELAPIDKAMHAYAAQQQVELAAQRKRLQPAADQQIKPARLDLEFSLVTQTQDFVSALAEGESDFGGAHPQPLRATFTQHLPSGSIVALTDLFSDPDAALKIMSDETQRRLEADFEGRLRQENLPDKQFADRLKSMRQLVEQGAAAKAENFSAFLVDGVDGKAIGITLIFPAAQVAAYVDGPQQIEVPVRLFYDAIKPAYRDAFDKEDARPADKPPGAY